MDVSYDTAGRSILLKQDFTGIGPTAWLRYQYNASGYLTSVQDITSGTATAQLIDSFIYDGNNDLLSCLTYENKTIPYVTSFSASGKQVIMYDTAYSGYLGGSVFGKGTILYNVQNQITDRYLISGSSTQTTAVVQDHEIFSYDDSSNIIEYTLNESRNYQDSNGNPDSSFSAFSEFYNQRDGKANELYLFENILLKGVINLMGGNELIDPLYNVIGTSKTLFFQSQKSILLQGNFRNGYNFSNQPQYDSLSRLTKTSVYDYQMPGEIAVYLSYY